MRPLGSSSTATGSSGSSSSTRSAICRSRTSPCARRTATPTTACVSPRRFAASPSSARARMENALRACCSIKIGKLLIERRDGTASRGVRGTPMGGLAPSHANKLKRGAGGSGSGDSASPGGLAGLVANAANAASSPLGTSDDGDRDENDVLRVARESAEINKRRSALAKDSGLARFWCLASCTRRCPATSPSGTCYFWIPS